MTLKKQQISESTNHPALRREHFGDGDQLVIYIKTAPEVIKTKYRDEQVVVAVTSKGNTYCWWMNQKSVNYLIDEFGDNENVWVNKSVQLKIVKQYVNGSQRDTIYPLGV